MTSAVAPVSAPSSEAEILAILCEAGKYSHTPDEMKEMCSQVSSLMSAPMRDAAIREQVLERLAVGFETFMSRRDSVDIGYVVDSIRACKSNDKPAVEVKDWQAVTGRHCVPDNFENQFTRAMQDEIIALRNQLAAPAADAQHVAMLYANLDKAASLLTEAGLSEDFDSEEADDLAKAINGNFEYTGKTTTEVTIERMWEFIRVAAGIDIDDEYSLPQAIAKIIENASVEKAFPAELTPELEQILGMMCYATSSVAHMYRACGIKIRGKTEAEQAFVLHRMIGFYLKHGDGWRDAMNEDLESLKRDAVAGEHP